MSDSYQYVLQLNPYLLKWSGEMDSVKSFDARVSGQDDCLGNFWNIGISLESLSSVEKVLLHGCDHPFFRKYWQTTKRSVNENDANALKEICEKILPFPEEIEEDHFPEHADSLSRIISKASGGTSVADYVIHLFWSDQESGRSLIKSIQNDLVKSKLLSDLKIRIDLESDPQYLKIADGQTPKPAVVSIVRNQEEFSLLKNAPFFYNHICFRVPKETGGQNDDVIFVNGRSLDTPSFWIPGTKEELSELVWQYIDFYFLRWRYLELWDHYISSIQWKTYDEAARFIRLGIMNQVAVLDEQTYSSSVVVNHNAQFAWHREPPDLALPAHADVELTASCSEHQVSVSTHDDGGMVEMSTGLEDIGKDLPLIFEQGKSGVESENNLFVLQRNGTITRNSRYVFPVKVEDDGDAAGIAIVCSGPHENRNGRWCFPAEEDVLLSYEVKPHQNGSWSSKKDPVSFRVNGKPADNPYPVPKSFPESGAVFTAKAETRSGIIDTVSMYKLPRANAILQNCAQVISGDYACSVSHERSNLGLSPKSSHGKRVVSIRCAQNTKFVLESRGVFQKDPSTEVWNDQCDCQLYDSKNALVPNGVWERIQKGNNTLVIQIKLPGNYILLTKSLDISDVEFPISFSVFADHSKAAFGVLIATFVLSLVATFVWFGLNLWIALVYLACPLTLLFILMHKEGCIQNKIQNIFFYLAGFAYIIILCKALFEELQ